MPTLTLARGFGAMTLLAVLAVAFTVAAYFYRRSFRSLPPAQWWQLYVLRAVALAIVVLLWFRPVFSVERERMAKKSLVFLIDTSASMGIADDPAGNSRLEQVKGRIVDWSARLQKHFHLQYATFAESAEPLEKLEQLAAMQPNGLATSLSRPLSAATQMAPPGGIEGIVLVSDGVHNSAGDPLKVAPMLGLPVYAVGAGNSLRGPSFHDIRVTNLECPEQLPVNNLARLKGYIEATGFAGRVVKLVLEEDGKPAAELELTLDAAEGPQEVAFDFVPSAKGLHTYTLRAATAAEEKVKENNRRSASSLVIDARIRVLYLEGTLRAEYGALTGRFLAKDPNIEFCALVQTRPNVFTERSNIAGFHLAAIPDDPQAYQQFDVFLLGDLDSSFFKPKQMELLRERVSQGGGLLAIGGYHTLGPGGYAGTPIEDALPVFLGPRNVGQITQRFLPALTPDGRNHPAFANIVGFFPRQAGRPGDVAVQARQAGLPPLEGCVRVERPKPGATVLAVYSGDVEESAKPPAEKDPAEGKGNGKKQDKKKNEKETSAGPPSPRGMPVMAVQQYGKGRSAVFTGDTTWNWHQTLRALDQESPFLRFWGQTIRWLAGRGEAVDAAANLRAATDKAYCEPASPIAVSAVVRDEGGEGNSRAQVNATITDPRKATRTLELSPVPGPAGNYRAVFEPELTGRYEIAVSASLASKVLTAEKLLVDVGRPNLEFDRLDLDEKLLTAIAEGSGGRYAHLSAADRLIDDLDRKQEKQRVELELPLSWPPLFWAAFVGVLTAEWTLRRRYRLR